MGCRPPNDTELAYINANMAKEEMAADKCSVIDGVSVANDYMKTCYNYFLADDSLTNFVNDLGPDGNVPLQVNHGGGFLQSGRVLPMGRWFNGALKTTDSAPDDARLGKNCLVEASLYMPNGLEFGGYNTDDIALAYKAGTLTDVSIGQDWTQASFECNICHKDIMNYEECSHIPGREYDGQQCTFDVHGSHLGEISVVWSGGLPGATLSADPANEASAAKLDWEAIKKVGKFSNEEIVKLSRLSMPMGSGIANLFSHNSTLGEHEPSWGSVDKGKLPRAAFADKGEAGKKSTWGYPHHWVQNGGGEDENGVYTTGTMYLHKGGLKAAWDAANGARSGQQASSEVKAHLQAHRKALGLDKEEDNSMTFEELCEKFKDQIAELYVPKADHETVMANLSAKTTECEAATQRYADLVEETGREADILTVGKDHMAHLTSEFHRLSVALHGDKHDEETQNQYLSAMSVADRVKWLNSTIETLKADLAKITHKEEVQTETETKRKEGSNPHLDNPNLYKV